MNVRRAGAALLVTLAAAGCGGEEEPAHFLLGPTRACLEAENVPVAPPRRDFVASTATGGALNARLPPNEVTVTFGATPAEAARLEAAYRQFAPKRLPIDDVLIRTDNIVMVWAGKPNEFDLARVTECLREEPEPR